MEGIDIGFVFLLLAAYLCGLLASIPCTILAHRTMMRPIARRTYMELRQAPFQFSIADIVALVTLTAILLGLAAAVQPSGSTIVVGTVLVPFVWWRGIKRLNAAEFQETLPRFACLVVCFPLVWAVDLTVVYVVMTLPFAAFGFVDPIQWCELMGGTWIAGGCARLFLELICSRPAPPKPEGRFPRHAGRIARSRTEAPKL